MTKTQVTKNGRKVNTFVKNTGYELSFTRPVSGRREAKHLNITATNPLTGEVSKVRLNGNAIAALSRILA